MPPLQFIQMPAVELVMLMTIGGAGSTARFIVAVFDKLPGSVTLTTKLLVPTTLESGVPESVPSVPTVNHAGPLTFANASTSPELGSVALVAIVPEEF